MIVTCILIIFFVQTTMQLALFEKRTSLSDEIEEAVTKMTHDVVLKYFSGYPCLVVVTEDHSYLPDYMPKNLPLVHIQIGKGVLQGIEETDNLMTTETSPGTQALDKLLTAAYDLQCHAIVAEVRNYKALIFSLNRASRLAYQRKVRRFLFVPKAFDIACGQSCIDARLEYLTELFKMKELSNLPDMEFLEVMPYCNKDNSKPMQVQDLKIIPYAITDASDVERNCSNSTFEETVPEFVNGEDNQNLNPEKVSERDPSKHQRFGVQIFTHKFVSNTPWERLSVHEWCSDEDFNILTESNLFENKVTNMENKTLNVNAIDYYLPYCLVVPETGFCDGLECMILHQLAKLQNFTLWGEVDNEYLWGTIYPNGSGNGILGKIAMGGSVFVGGAIYGTWYTISVYTDISLPITRAAMTGVMPAPKQLPRWHALILPFSSQIWNSVGVMFVVSTVATYLVARFSEKFLDENGNAGPYNTLLNCALQIYGILVLQTYGGVGEEERYLILRTLTTLLDIMIHTLSNIYIGGLAAVLTIPRYEKPIDTLVDMATTNIQWAAPGEAFVFSIQGTGDPVLETIVRNFHDLSDERLEEEALKAEIGFVLEKLSGGSCALGLHLSKEAMTKLRIMSEPLYWGHVIICTQKSSPYTPPLRKLIYSLQEAGILLYWEGEMIRKYHSGCGEGAEYDSGPINLQVGHLQGIFIVLILGCLVATLVFIGENLDFKLRNRKTRKNEFKNTSLMKKLKMRKD